MAAPARTPPALEAPARIDTCEAEFEVAAAQGPLSSPETLLAAVRQELLPALPHVLDEPQWQNAQITIPQIEIDLGTWPDEPVWSDVRHVLALKLRHALEAHRRARRSDTTADQPQNLTSAARPSNTSADGSAEMATPVQEASAMLTPTAQNNETLATQVSDPEPAAAQKDFANWLRAQDKLPSPAQILAHLADRPALRAALRKWQVADRNSQDKALPLSPTERENIKAVTDRMTVSQRQPEGSQAQAPTRQETLDTEAQRLLHERLSELSPAQVQRLRTTAQWLAEVIRQGGVSTEAAKDHSQMLLTRLLTAPTLAWAFDPDHATEDPSPLTGSTTPFHGSTSAQQPSTFTSGETEQVLSTQRPAEEGEDWSTSATDHPTDEWQNPSSHRGDREPGGGAQPLSQLATLAVALADQSSALPEDSDALLLFVQQQFTRHPALVFDAAERLGLLPVVAVTLRSTKVAGAVLRGPKALSTGSIRALHSADPAALPAALKHLSAHELQHLARRLLPARADLLRDQISALLQQAKHPAHALQNAVLAILDERPVDVEALRKSLPEESALMPEPTQEDPAPTPTKDRQTHFTSAAPPHLREITPRRLSERTLAHEHPAQRPHTGQSRETGASSGTMTPLHALLSLSGLTEAEIARLLPPPTRGILNRPSKALSEPLTDAAERKPNNKTHSDEAVRKQLANTSAQADSEFLQDFLSRSGLTPAEIARVLAPPAPRPLESRSRAPSDPVTDTTNQRSNHQPRSDEALWDHLDQLAHATAPADDGSLRDMLALIWSLWPQAIEMDSASASEAMPPLPVLLAQLAAATTPTDGTPHARLALALPLFEPDISRQVFALRTVLARLSSLSGPDLTGLRATTRSALHSLLAPSPDAIPRQNPNNPAAPLDTETHDFADRSSAGEETFQITETAGLVLLHPFYTLLFERLKIERNGKALLKDDLPGALAALQFLAGEAPENDPLLAVLLGLDTALPLPEAATLDDDARTLMDGLLRSVIDRWGRLGATSPDGLRQTFIKRTGTLRFDETGAHLRVTPGPFDMLLDGLPWSLSPVALPWMPLPCLVSWREDEDA